MASGTSYMEARMTEEKNVLVVGLDPTLIDFSQPGYAPGMNAMKVPAGLKSSEDELTRLGYSVQMCLTDFGETIFHALTQMNRIDRGADLTIHARAAHYK